MSAPEQQLRHYLAIVSASMAYYADRMACRWENNNRCLVVGMQIDCLY